MLFENLGVNIGVCFDICNGSGKKKQKKFSTRRGGGVRERPEGGAGRTFRGTPSGEPAPGTPGVSLKTVGVSGNFLKSFSANSDSFRRDS